MPNAMIHVDIYTEVFYTIVLLGVATATLLRLPVRRLALEGFDDGLVPGTILVAFLVLYIGLRPVHEIFVDMPVYANLFFFYERGGQITSLKDPFFHVATKFISSFSNVQGYFLILALAYVAPIVFACRLWFKKEWFFGVVFFFSALSFWPYAVNGVRNGVATSLFLLVMAARSFGVKLMLSAIAIGMHKSILLPLFAYIIALTRVPIWALFGCWLLSIPVSILFGEQILQLVLSLGVEDERMGYFSGDIGSEMLDGGFRWDFVVYSLAGVLLGAYYIYRKELRSRTYKVILGTYLISNAAWVLVMGVAYSNRFAYLSWFLLPAVLGYPLVGDRSGMGRFRYAGVLLGMGMFSVWFGWNLV